MITHAQTLDDKVGYTLDELRGLRVIFMGTVNQYGLFGHDDWRYMMFQRDGKYFIKTKYHEGDRKT